MVSLVVSYRYDRKLSSQGSTPLVGESLRDYGRISQKFKVGTLTSLDRAGINDSWENTCPCVATIEPES